MVAKSSIILDVKPWDDETDMKKMEECVRSIVMDGLLWGACMYYLQFLLYRLLNSKIRITNLFFKIMKSHFVVYLRRCRMPL